MKNPAKKCDILCGGLKKNCYDWIEEADAVVEVV
jgi:hypothetical protein